jgi:hypothetical protein
VHGPTLLIEYDNTQNNANHIHSVWHDPKRDFGLDLLRAHYEHGHHHLGGELRPPSEPPLGSRMARAKPALDRGPV